MTPYNDLIDAARLIETARRAVGKEDGPGLISPAWKFLRHAQDYLLTQAETVLRSGAVS